MVTLDKIGEIYNRMVLELSGESTDVKPIEYISDRPITNNSIFKELDTGIDYKYSEEAKKWIPQPKSSGGGGADGREIELQTSVTHIQWKYVGEEEWKDLVSLEELSFKYSDFTKEQLDALKGQKGDKGNDGVSITKGEINASGNLVLTFSNGTTKDVGKVVGKDGNDGISPTVTTSKTGNVTTITITDATGTKTATINDGKDATGDIEKVTLTEGEVTIPPNKFVYITGADGKDYVSNVNITLEENSVQNIVSQYHFMFKTSTDDSVETTLSLPDSIHQNGLEIENNKIYEIDIIENCMTYLSWDVNE